MHKDTEVIRFGCCLGHLQSKRRFLEIRSFFLWTIPRRAQAAKKALPTGDKQGTGLIGNRGINQPGDKLSVFTPEIEGVKFAWFTSRVCPTEARFPLHLYRRYPQRIQQPDTCFDFSS